LVANIEGGTKLRVFENRALRRIFGPKRDEVTGYWRKLYNEKLNDLSVHLTQYCAGDEIEKNDMGVAVWGRVRCVQGVGGET
jgi:hypothetical protein